MGLNFVEEELDIVGFKDIEKCMPDRLGIEFKLFW